MLECFHFKSSRTRDDAASRVKIRRILGFSPRGSLVNRCPKRREIAWVREPMDHTVAIRTQNRKVCRHVVLDRHAFRDRSQMMGFDKTPSYFAVTLGKLEFACLTAGTMEFLGVARSGAIAFDFAVVRVFSSFNNGGLRRDTKLFIQV